MNELFRGDYYRRYGKPFRFPIGNVKWLFSHSMRFLYFYRKKSGGGALKFFYCWKLEKFKKKYGLEIFSDKIGRGLYLGHAFNITVNRDAVLGERCSLHKGVTIGQENRGIRKGSPLIGNKVWIGVNATVVGKITIGDDVLIAPNSYVNCDVPSHSVVFGNPCIIKHKENATEGYI